MYKVGVFAGKFTPLHNGHLYAIINASTKCEKLYVIVSDNPVLTKQLCDESKLPYMDMKLRAKWLSQELQNFDHIKVLMLDEIGIPVYPYGWDMWQQKLKDIMPEEFDVIFGGEEEYKDHHKKHFPNAVYETFDCNREKFPVSATQIRNNPFKYWEFIPKSVRPFFTKKVLITGTESAGKSTITNYLAKIYNTSCTYEEGRYYSERYLGKNEDVFTIEDFEKIAYLQSISDNNVLNLANKVVFYDTDAIVTQYYAGLYIDEHSDLIDNFVDSNKYDLVLLFTPDVDWVDDGLRLNSEQSLREGLHKRLKQMYISHGFENKIVEISGNYNERLQKSIELVDLLLV